MSDNIGSEHFGTGSPKENSVSVDIDVDQNENHNHSNDSIDPNNMNNDGSIDHNAVLSLANSIAESLYGNSNDDQDKNGASQNSHHDLGNANDTAEKNDNEIAVAHQLNEPSLVYNYNEDSKGDDDGIDNIAGNEDKNDDGDYDFDFDQEALIKNIVGNAVESLENQMITESVDEENTNHNDEVTNNETAMLSAENKGDSNVTTLQSEDTAERQHLWADAHHEGNDNNHELEEIQNNELENVIADVFNQFDFHNHDAEQDRLQNLSSVENHSQNANANVNSSEPHASNDHDDDANSSEPKVPSHPLIETGTGNEDATKDDHVLEKEINMDLMTAITEALEQNIENVQKSENATTIKNLRDENPSVLSINPAPSSTQLQKIENEKESVSGKSSTKEFQHTTRKHDDTLVQAELNAAIEDALKNTQSFIENQDNNTKELLASANGAFDSYYDDMQTLVNNAVSEVKAHYQTDIANEKDFLSNNDVRQPTKKQPIGDEDLEKVIHDIDLNDVMQTALKETSDTNTELDKVIKEALLSVPAVKKKLNKKASNKKKAVKSQTLEKKKTVKENAAKKNNNDISNELNTVIAAALKDSALTDKPDNNEFVGSTTIEFENALKEVVNDVIEHNIAENNVEDNQEEVSIVAEKESNDYNWDDIMGKAFEMAMEYPDDLNFKIDDDETETSNLDMNKKHVSLANEPVTFVQKPINDKVADEQPAPSKIQEKEKSVITSIQSPAKPTVIETVNNILGSLNLEIFNTKDLLKIKSSQLDMIKKSVASTISSLMNSKGQNVKEEKPKEIMSEKERIRFENRERKKRWREFNIERNRDIDLKTRVIKRANHLYPNPEHEELKKEWISVEFDKRKQRRLERQQKRDISCIDIKIFDSKDALPFDNFFKNKNNIIRVAQIYNKMGGDVSEEKLLSSSSDKIVTLTSIASVIAVSYLLDKDLRKSDDGDFHSIIQSIVVTLARYLSKTNSKELHNNVLQDGISTPNPPPPFKKDTSLAVVKSVDLISKNMATSNKNESEASKTSSQALVPNFVGQIKPMKLAPVSGGVSFRVQSQDREEADINPPSYHVDMALTKMVKERSSSAKTSENQVLKSQKLNKRNNKKDLVQKPKRKQSTPIPVNIEKFLLPKPPPVALLLKRKSDEVSGVIPTEESIKKKPKSNPPAGSDSNGVVDLTSTEVKETARKLDLEGKHPASTSAVEASEENATENVEEGIDKKEKEIVSVTAAKENEKTEAEVNVEAANIEIENEAAAGVGSNAKTDAGEEERNDYFDRSSKSPASSSMENAVKENRVTDVVKKKPIAKEKKKSFSGETRQRAEQSAKVSVPRPKTVKKATAFPKVAIPSIPLPHYGAPKPNSSSAAKFPVVLKKSSSDEKPVSIVGIKRPGAFRKPVSFKKPDASFKNYKIMKPFGGISSVKKL